jgi:hypothetical protein
LWVFFPPDRVAIIATGQFFALEYRSIGPGNRRDAEG